MGSLLPGSLNALKQVARASSSRVIARSSTSGRVIIPLQRLSATPGKSSRILCADLRQLSGGSPFPDFSRSFSSSNVCRKEEWPKVSVTQPETGQPSLHDPSVAKADIPDAPSTTTAAKAGLSDSTPSIDVSLPHEPVVKHVRDEDLPSRRAALRSRMTKWFNTTMEELIPKLLLASHRINTFTGTDYSAIEELRREIKEQEQLVRARHLAVTKAKEALEQAHVQRGASQKEVVGLLERKHSWSAADLERYMNLIRSEHQNDHAVQEAKDAVNTTEKALEESRARLETRERRQYHEEQIWSDTIRRNSTWITFGLMGVNFLLLLLNLVVFEPYRRRKIVREIKAALDEKSITASPNPASSEFAAPVIASAAIESTPPTSDTHTVEPIASAPTETVLTSGPVEVANSRAVAPIAEDLPEPAAPMVEQEDAPAFSSTDVEPAVPAATVEPATTEERGPTAQVTPDLWTIEGLKAYAADLVSERQTTMRKLDITTIAVESAVAGAAFVALLIVMLRPNP